MMKKNNDENRGGARDLGGKRVADRERGQAAMSEREFQIDAIVAQIEALNSARERLRMGVRLNLS